MSALRKAHERSEAATKSREIKFKLFALDNFSNAKIVSFYLSMETEVQTGEMVQEALDMGKKVAVPYIDTETDGLILSEIKDIERELAPGPHKILQPLMEYLRPISLNQVDLIAVPGLAFDMRRNRLGFGKGYYDRLLAQKTTRTISVGLAFHFQVLEEIPTSSHDVPMDLVITEKGLIGTESKIRENAITPKI